MDQDRTQKSLMGRDMAGMEKRNGKNWIKRGGAVLLGIVLAILLEGVIGIYRINRGYGQNSSYFPLTVANVNDYVVGGEDNSLWLKTGEIPCMFFYPKRELGHIRLRFKEPLTQEMDVQCSYGQNNFFHVLQQKNNYLVEGTTEAAFTVPYGKWDSFCLSIKGDFFLEAIEGAEAVPLAFISGSQVMEQVNGVRLFLFLFFFISGGLLLAIKGEKAQEKKAAGAVERPRVVFLDGIRVLATFMVIVVHVWGVLEKMSVLQEKKEVYLLFLIGQFVSISCNPLFFMISGALLLPWREESFSVFVRKRLIKVVLPLLVYGCVYIFLLSASQASLQEWTAVYMWSMIRGSVRMAPHLWMVFELIAMYVLVLPLRGLLKNASEQTEKLLAVFILVLMTVYSASHYWRMELAFSTFLNGWTGVFLFGYLMNRSWMRRYDRLWMIGGILGLAAGVSISMYMGNSSRYVFGTSIFVLLIACGIYAAVLHLEVYLQKIKKALLFVSKYSYSVLLIHWFVLYHILFIQGMSPLMPKVAFVLLTLFLCSLLSFLFAFVADHMVVAVLEQGIHQAAKFFCRCLPGRKRKS